MRQIFALFMVLINRVNHKFLRVYENLNAIPYSQISGSQLTIIRGKITKLKPDGL